MWAASFSILWIGCAQQSGQGPHSIIGPIYVNGAEPGDVLERPLDWAAVFSTPGSIGTRLLAKDFAAQQALRHVFGTPATIVEDVALPDT